MNEQQQIQLYNKVLATAWRDFWIELAIFAGLLWLGVSTAFLPLLSILCIVQLIKAYFAWMTVEAVRSSTVLAVIETEPPK
jgi:hypothetical protein